MFHELAACQASREREFLAGADRESLLSHMVFALERTAVRGVFVDGEPVIEEGHHAREEQIVQEFAELQRRSWNTLN